MNNSDTTPDMRADGDRDDSGDQSSQGVHQHNMGFQVR